MRHHDRQTVFGRKLDERRALLRSLARELILRGSITTTLARAKALRPFVERLITIARNDSIAARRIVSSRLGNDDAAVKALVALATQRFADRPGGYTRIVKLGKDRNAIARATIMFVE
ncbi:MAG: 50S ribosomal protein L17 [Candidatus Parcubacteria bacterium]|nr:MAG: 50S ribosomal protein L17 [Candidatus Parcubacteria bacterium]